MIIQPIIPIWIAAIICVFLFFLRIKEKGGRWLQLLICLLLFAINLRPMILEGNVQVQKCNLDVVIVVDNTLSMRAEDYQDGKQRMQGIVDTVVDVTNGLPGARFALISFDNNSQIMAPLTYDADMIVNAVNALHTIDKLYAKGSSLNTPMDDMERILKSSREAEEDRKTVVIYISDGEITSNDDLLPFTKLREYTDAGMVVGIGTKEGGKMRFAEDYAGQYMPYLNDPRTGEPAVSKLDENNLRKIAKDLEIDYLHYTKAKDADSYLEDINQMSKEAGVDSKEGAKDTYMYFAIPLLVILLLEWFWFEKKKGVL